jgi:hypothetical protein
LGEFQLGFGRSDRNGWEKIGTGGLQRQPAGGLILPFVEGGVVLLHFFGRGRVVELPLVERKRIPEVGGGMCGSEGGGEGGEEEVAEAEVAVEGRGRRSGVAGGDFHGIEADILIDYILF